MDLNLLAVLLLTPLPIMGAVAIYAWQQRSQQGPRLLLALMIVGCMMTVAYVGDLFGQTLQVKLLWLNLWYFSSNLIAPLLFLLALWHVGQDQWLTPKRMALVFAPVALILLLFYTNELHHQFYVSFGLDASTAPPLRTSVRGPLYCCLLYTSPSTRD